MKARLSTRRQRLLVQRVVDTPDCITTSEAVFQLCTTIGCGVVPWATPRWWIKRRIGGTWKGLRVCDDASEDFWEKLHMPRRVFMEISEACAPHLQRQVTFYRELLQPEQIVVYALYRWVTGETYNSSTSSFGVGRASGLITVCDVTSALLRVYADKISWPTGVQKHVVLRAFLEKGFPNCHGVVDCTHIYVDKLTNAPNEDYFDRKHHFSMVAQVVVDLDLLVLDVFVRYLGNCHDIRIIQLSSLSRRAKEGMLFRGSSVTLPGGVTRRTNGYILGDNGYPPSEWLVVPYGGINQYPDEERFDTKQKVARGAVERAFGRLKGMWRLFLRTHKTNLDTLSQQFTAVCILHNILLDARIEFDENLLWEVDRNGVWRRVDLGIQLPPKLVSNATSTDEALMFRDALAERMKHFSYGGSGEDEQDGEDAVDFVGSWHGQDDGRDEVDMLKHVANLCAVYVDGVWDEEQGSMAEAVVDLDVGQVKGKVGEKEAGNYINNNSNGINNNNSINSKNFDGRVAERRWLWWRRGW
ncbi:hypothetical protein CBR_g45578 [Chara braunii]|uniref:DDE Tnp4 domain-containing protein n=1 Tax=Chara braunii TaxID=69332 RepID=A0A388LYW7_CHABU|nr:hypothetical protein CBR_g45578 [Chara braunii]|eukprot:GBG87520.1 hypothetical protein CBR_g45578 [Chara braunii]